MQTLTINSLKNIKRAVGDILVLNRHNSLRLLRMAPGKSQKRQLSLDGLGANKHPSKKTKSEPDPSEDLQEAPRPPVSIYELPGKVASFEAAAAVDADPPLGKLMKVMESSSEVLPGESVVYWMRMEDMRIDDNRALEFASAHAKKHSIPLIVMFVISPGDYKSHDRSPRRIDFMLRNLRILQSSLADLNIPLHVFSCTPRTTIPSKVASLSKQWRATRIFANVEYEVDEIRRDIRTAEFCREEKIEVSFVHDKLIVEPGTLSTKQGKQYAVYSPWLKSWTEHIRTKPSLLKAFKSPAPNNPSIHKSDLYGSLFNTKVPDSVSGFECSDREKMQELWPAGINAARKMFDRFLHTKARSSQLGDASPLAEGAKGSTKDCRISDYKDDRNRCDIDGSSRMSPYLASGVISAREIVRKTMEFDAQKKIDPDRKTGPGAYISEVAWRDFYTHVLVAFPRTSMGRPYQEKYADVVWETDEKHLEAWKAGKTGVPIVDAAMRQANTQGWMHNRARMIAAMYLSKDLMLDWRLGERYFMQNFIDGDLASNNGGWQWSASTGTDPQPYFRIFNPYSQSEKADPNGDYIRHFVPELKDLKGKALHDPSHVLDKSEFKMLGYPAPLVDHAKARERALRRFKNPGDP